MPQAVLQAYRPFGLLYHHWMSVPVYETLMGRPVGHIEEVPDQRCVQRSFRLRKSFELGKYRSRWANREILVKAARRDSSRLVEVTDINAVLSHYKDAGIRLIDDAPWCP